MVVKKFRGVIVTLFFIMFLSVFAPYLVAAADKQRIYDEANLLTAEQISALEEVANKFSVRRETDFVIITTDDSDGKDIEKFMADFYDERKLGYDREHGNAAILAIDMAKRDVMLMGFYKAKERLDAERLTMIREEINPDLSAGNYYQAFHSYLTLADDYIRYKKGVDPNNPFFRTGVQFAVALILGILIVWLMVRNVGTKITTTAATYRDQSRTRIVSQRDKYVRTTVTKRRKPKPNNSSGGGGGFTGGGTTGGGHSYSSSRGKF